MQYLEQQPRSCPTSGPSGFATVVRQAPPELPALPFSRSYFFPARFPHDSSVLTCPRQRAPPAVYGPHAPIWFSLRDRQEEGI